MPFCPNFALSGNSVKFLAFEMLSHSTFGSEDLSNTLGHPLDNDGPSRSEDLEVKAKPQENSCSICRRKLRCDGGNPSCGTCVRLGHECTYEERRKKSRPRRGYVKGLENQLCLCSLLPQYP